MTNDETQELETHPAYAIVTVSRISGHRYLFSSPVAHRTFIRLGIQRAELKRSLNSDHTFGGDHLIEVDLSEAQWAQMVSSHNLGGGTPCTLAWLPDVGYVEPIPAPPHETEKFRKDLRSKLSGVLGHFRDLRAKVAEAQISPPRKSDINHIAQELASLEQELRSNLPFIAKMFEETMDETMAKMKIEFEAYVAGRVQHLGLDTLSSSPVALPEPAVRSDDSVEADEVRA